MFQDFITSLEKLFTKRRCIGCESKDYTIQMLREELREERLFNEELNSQIISINRHLLRMDVNEVVKQGETVSFNRRPKNIFNKLREVETKSSEESKEQVAARKKAYDDRLAIILKEPEEEKKEEVAK